MVPNIKVLMTKKVQATGFLTITSKSQVCICNAYSNVKVQRTMSWCQKWHTGTSNDIIFKTFYNVVSFVFSFAQQVLQCVAQAHPVYFALM